MKSLLIALGSTDIKRVARAAKSIVFKIRNGLVEANSTSTETIGQICSAVEAQLKLFQENLPLSSEAAESCVLLCELFVSMIQEELVIRGDPRLAATLQALMILKEGDANIGQRSQVLEAIRMISSIAVTQPILPDIIDQQAGAADQVMEDSWTYTANAPQQSQRMQRSTRGAGAILYSSLLQYGWRFPIVKVSEADEKYLFDLEVKLKLKHDTALSTLLDAFSDFPASLLVQRVGLLHVLLDLAGAPFSFADFEQKPLGYHAYTALTCLHELYAKAVHERQVFEDGGMVTVSSAPQAEDDGEEFKSSALDQAESIQQYRYPSTANTARTTTGLLPPPTFSGLAFALVAAVLPLLVSSDAKLATLAVRVFHIAMPHVLEGNNVSSHDQKKLSNENCGRLRHLLSRFEQLLANVQFNELFATFWTLLRTHVNEQDTPSSMQRIQMVEELSTTSIVFILLDCFLRCIGCLHPQWMQSYHSNEENPHLLTIGANTLRLLIALSSSSNRVQVLFAASSSTSAISTIDTILAKVDPISSLQARTSAEHADSIVLFQQLCSVQDDTEHFLGGLEALEHLQDIVKRAEVTFPYLLTHEVNTLQYIEVDILVHLMQAIDVFNVQNQYEDQVILSLQFQLASMLVLVLSLGSDQHLGRLLNDQVMKIVMATVSYRQRLCEDFVVAILGERILDHQQQQRSEATLPLLQLLLMNLNTASKLSGDRKIKLTSSLQWVKVVFWSLDQQTFRHEYTQFEQVLRHLESDFEVQEKAWIMGLFHQRQEIRVECAVNLRRHVMHEQSSIFSHQEDESPLLFGKAIDPFHPGSFLVLKDIATTQDRALDASNKQHSQRTKNTKDKTKKKVFSHQDMQELCNIGFGNNLDIAVQLSALLQLRQMMNDDIELLLTSDEQWLHREVLTKALMLMEEILFTDSKQKVNIDCLLKLRRVDCEYVLACMQLVHFILTHRAHSSHHINMQLFIKLMLLAQETLDQMPNSVCEGSKLLKQMAFLCADLLHFQSFSAQNWCVEDRYERVSSRFMFADGRVWSATLTATSAAVVVPMLVVHSFGQPDVVTDQKTLILSDLMSSSSRGFVSTAANTTSSTATTPAVAKRDYQLNETEEEDKKPSMSLVLNALADLQSPPENRVHMAIVTTCFDLLLTAENHKQVYNTCRLLQSLAVIFGSSLDRVFVALNIDVVTAVSKIVTTLPRTRKDHFTFYHVLHFLNDHLSRLLQTARDDHVSYHRVIIAVAELCLPTIAELLISPQHIQNKTTAQFIDLRKAIETELFALLKITTSFSSDNFAIGALLLTNTDRIRSKCLGIILNLLQYDHQGAVLLRSLESEDQEGSYFAPLQRLIRIAKLLRSPDSFQEHSLVTLSLHAIMLFIQYEITEHTMQLDQVRNGEFWSWLVRLLYDRRAEVRFLAVDTIRLLLPHTTPDGLAAGEQTEQRLFAWPPLEQLYHLTMDTYECSDIKAKCLLITTQYIHLYHTANDTWIVPFPMIRSAESLDSLLHIETSHVSVRGLLDILEVLRLLFSANRSYLEDIMVLFRSLKVFPRLVGLLHDADVKRQRLAARSRRFSSSSLSSDGDRESVLASNSLFAKQEDESKMTTILHESLLHFFLLLSDSQPKQFEEIVLRSKLMLHLTNMMNEALFISRGDASTISLVSLRLELMLLSRILELIMTIITHPLVFHTAIRSQQGLEMIEAVIETVAKGLSKLYLINEKDPKKDFLLQAFITKAMKCIGFAY